MSNELFNDWIDTKEKILYYQHKLEKLKRIINSQMDKNDCDSINNSKYEIYRKEMTRQTITRNNVPRHIWDQYSTKTEPYFQFYTRKLK
jgi:hypothetical protein